MPATELIAAIASLLRDAAVTRREIVLGLQLTDDVGGAWVVDLRQPGAPMITLPDVRGLARCTVVLRGTAAMFSALFRAPDTLATHAAAGSLKVSGDRASLRDLGELLARTRSYSALGIRSEGGRP